MNYNIAAILYPRNLKFRGYYGFGLDAAAAAAARTPRLYLTFSTFPHFFQLFATFYYF